MPVQCNSSTIVRSRISDLCQKLWRLVLLCDSGFTFEKLACCVTGSMVAAAAIMTLIEANADIAGSLWTRSTHWF